MNVQYKGRQTANSFGDKLVRPLEPAAIISFTEEEEDKVVAILEETGYDFDIFGEPGFLGGSGRGWQGRLQGLHEGMESGQGGVQPVKSNPVKVSGKLFRYDFDHSVVEYIIKADAETISEENEWKRKHGSPLFGIDPEGYIVCSTAGLNAGYWHDADVRREYLSAWANEVEEEANRLAEDFVKNEIQYLKEETK